MRHQENIYIQNENGAVRNKDILNVNMSSDFCIFESPLFNLSGASKIDCTGTTGTSYVISSATTIPFIFEFTGNTNSFSGNNATFKFEIYKFNNDLQQFTLPPQYKSELIQYSAISATSSTTQIIPISGLSLDGDYLVKGYYEYDACTEFMYQLGKRNDTLVFRGGSEYGLYDNSLDYYFIAINEAATPKFGSNSSNQPQTNQLFQQIILPEDGQTNLTITNSYNGTFILTLNGLVLANQYDYVFSGNVITLSGAAKSDDIITVIYTTAVGSSSMVGDNLLVNSSITSGTTNNQGLNNVYFNTTTGKYEIYTSVNPSQNGDILVMLNGVTLANGIDYYKSSTYSRRIILEGALLVDDMITIVYFPEASVVNSLYTNNPTITWGISNAPQKVNGFFTLEVSTGNTFTNLMYTSVTDYVIGQTIYSNSFVASGSVGTTIYYRVKNEKNYETLCGDILTSINYSETIPITIITNAINSY